MLPQNKHQWAANSIWGVQDDDIVQTDPHIHTTPHPHVCMVDIKNSLCLVLCISSDVYHFLICSVCLVFIRITKGSGNNKEKALVWWAALNMAWALVAKECLNICIYTQRTDNNWGWGGWWLYPWVSAQGWSGMYRLNGLYCMCRISVHLSGMGVRWLVDVWVCAQGWSGTTILEICLQHLHISLWVYMTQHHWCLHSHYWWLR